MLLASVMTVPVRPGAVVTAGNELHFTGHVRWSFKKLGSVFVFLKKDNRSGLCSRSLSLLLGEGLRPAAEGQTSNQELGGPGDARDPMGALQGWSAKREAFAIQSQL